ncbi:MAG: hypothetical protein K0Q51_516 [Rickettsiaceae bacterium]|jgi:hypothetical protein|nr:hypothetical protein [Rickettsiaceae bacterium]
MKKKVIQNIKGNVLTKISMVQAAYNVTKEETLTEFFQKPQAEGWCILAKSNDQEETWGHYLNAIAYQNKNKKKVVIAIAGTHTGVDKQTLADLADDGLLAAGMVPTKYKDIKIFLGKVIGLIAHEGHLAEYEFETCGHSLGAVLSDIAALYLKEKGVKTVISTTFDNPGSKNAALKVTQEFENFKFNLNDLKTAGIKFDIYNSKPNNINTSNPQVTKVHQINGFNDNMSPNLSLNHHIDKTKAVASSFRNVAILGKETFGQYNNSPKLEKKEEIPDNKAKASTVKEKLIKDAAEQTLNVVVEDYLLPGFKWGVEQAYTYWSAPKTSIESSENIELIQYIPAKEEPESWMGMFTKSAGYIQDSFYKILSKTSKKVVQQKDEYKKLIQEELPEDTKEIFLSLDQAAQEAFKHGCELQSLIANELGDHFLTNFEEFFNKEEAEYINIAAADWRLQENLELSGELPGPNNS